MNRFAIIALFILAVMWVVPLPGDESPADGILERCSPTNTPAQMRASVPELINDRDRNCIYAECTNKADCAALEYRLMTNVVECMDQTEFDSVMTNMVEKFGMREKDIKRLSGL